MENFLGLLKVHVIRGVNLAIRDVSSSDPYVVVKMGKQKLKTRVVKKNINPEWNESLTLSIADSKLPVITTVYDKDYFSFDDKMGDAEIDIGPIVEAAKIRLEGLPDGTIIKRLIPSRENCYAEESDIMVSKGKVVQNMVLRLRHVESGEIEVQLEWIDISGSKAA